MVTVTFALRDAAVPQPEAAATAGTAPGAEGFAALFAGLEPTISGPGPAALSSVPVADAPAAAGEADVRTDRATDDRAGEGGKAEIAALPLPMPLPDPVLMPVSGSPMASHVVLMWTDEGQRPEPVPILDTLGAVPATPLSVETVTDRSAPGRDVQNGQKPLAEASSVPDARQTLSPPVPGPAPAKAVLPAADPLAAPPPETGLFILPEAPPSGPRAPSLASGMPAFWAAREVLGSGTTMAEDPVLPAPAMLVHDPKAPKPVRLHPNWADDLPTHQIDSDPKLPGGDDTAAQPEARAIFAPAASQTMARMPETELPSTSGAQGQATLPPRIVSQIATAVAERSERPLELRLAPEELGGVILNLRNEGEVLRVTVQADRPDTLELLRRNGDVLIEELRLAGFSGATLSFADGGGAQDRQMPAAPRPIPVSDASASSTAPPISAAAQTAQGLDLRL